MRREDRHSLRANWLLRTWWEEEGVGSAGLSTPRPIQGPLCPYPYLRGLPRAHNDELAVLQAYEHMAALLGHSHTADGHLHGQGRCSWEQSRGREGTRTRNCKAALHPAGLYILPCTLAVLI